MSKKEKVSQVISTELMKLIETGKYPPGSRLPTENELAAQFGVSRAPIREALSVLKAAGLVTSRQGGGNYVEEFTGNVSLQRIQVESHDAETIQHLFEMRKILEPEAASMAALKRTPEQLEQMKHFLKKMESESIDEGKSAAGADIEFHHSIILATQNPILIQVLESLRSTYEKVLDVTLRPNVSLGQKRKAVFIEHENILKAIEAEEPELAKIHSLIHLRNAEKKISLLLKDYSI